jgi:hypothetical protein
MNFDHKALAVLITGKKGSGKTTYWLKRIVAHRSRYKFVFDPSREVSRKLGWRVSIDEPGLCRSLVSHGRVCFDSSRLFPGNRREGFAFFTRWVFNVSKALPGVKCLAVDELQSCQETGPHGMPQGFKEIMDEGRREEIDCLFAAQRVNEVNDDVRGHLTELVTFKHDDPLPLRWLAERGFDPDAIRALPVPGCYISRTDDGKITTNAKLHRPRKADRAVAAKR